MRGVGRDDRPPYNCTSRRPPNCPSYVQNWSLPWNLPLRPFVLASICVSVNVPWLLVVQLDCVTPLALGLKSTRIETVDGVLCGLVCVTVSRSKMRIGPLVTGLPLN